MSSSPVIPTVLSICNPTFLDDVDSYLTTNDGSIPRLNQNKRFPIDSTDLMYYIAMRKREVIFVGGYYSGHPNDMNTYIEENGDITLIAIGIYKNNCDITANINTFNCQCLINNGDYIGCRDYIRKNMKDRDMSGYSILNQYITRDGCCSNYITIKDYRIEIVEQSPQSDYLPYLGIGKILNHLEVRSCDGSIENRMYILFEEGRMEGPISNYIHFASYPKQFYDTYIQPHYHLIELVRNSNLSMDPSSPIYQLYNVDITISRVGIADQMLKKLRERLRVLDCHFLTRPI